MTDWIYGVISVIIVAAIIGITKAIEKVKLEDLQGSQKILGIVAILAITGEIIYLFSCIWIITICPRNNNFSWSRDYHIGCSFSK